MVPPVVRERLTQHLERVLWLALGCDEFTADGTGAKESTRTADHKPGSLPVHDIHA
jgi:hypothetical protein